MALESFEVSHHAIAEKTGVYNLLGDTALHVSLHQFTFTQFFPAKFTNCTSYPLVVSSEMQFSIIITALSFSIGAHAWAQAANGEWIANDTKYYGFENARELYPSYKFLQRSDLRASQLLFSKHAPT